MGTSYVTVDGEHGFWMRDGILEFWLRLLALHIPEPTNADIDAIHRSSKQIRDGWLLASKGYFSGGVPVDLAEAVATPEGKSIIVAAIASVRDALLRQPPILDQSMFILLGLDETHFRGIDRFETRRLLETAQAFIDLLDGKITNTNSTAFMPGSQ